MHNKITDTLSLYIILDNGVYFMQHKYYHPLICTDKYSKTVAFYEDHFGFVVAQEHQDYVMMCHPENTDLKIAIIDMHAKCLPREAQQKTTGLIVNFPVDNVRGKYQEYYWEGLDILNDPRKNSYGNLFFMVRDPNGNYINVLEKRQTDESACCSGVEDYVSA